MPFIRTRLRRHAWIVVALGGLVGLVAVPAAADSASLKRSPSPIETVASRPSYSQNRDVRVHNQTGWTMTGLFVSAGGGWTSNLLRSGSFGPGDSQVVTLDDGSGGCLYALRAEFDNRQSLQRSGIDACRIADYYLTR